MKKTMAIVFVCLLSFVLLPGCQNDETSHKGGAGEDCLSDADCNEGLICYQQQCVFIDYPSDGDVGVDTDADPEATVDTDSDVSADVDADVDVDVDTDAGIDADSDDDKTCPQGFRICREDRVYTCDYGMWIAGMDCAFNHMVCIDGMKRCNGIMIYVCTNNHWVFMEDCNQLGYVCQDGHCVQEDQPDFLCPSGQTCTSLVDTGYMGCMEYGDVPAGNQTGCDQNTPCRGNATCHCMDQACTGTICIGNCGVCPPGQVCAQITPEGVKGCIEGDELPADSQTGCNENAPCTQNGGNASCYCRDAECRETVCVSNCT